MKLRFVTRIAFAAAVVLAVAPTCHAESAAPTPSANKPFEVRGIKGLWWDGIEKYQLAVPWLAKHNLNFLMLCYSSFDASGRNWRADYTESEMRDFAALAKQADSLGVRLCLSFNPGIWSNPPLEYSSELDYQLALRKVRLAHAAGIKWFGLCLDDINRALTPADTAKFANLQEAQVQFVNRLYNDMLSLEPTPVLIFCPSAYTTEDAARHEDYITTIGEKLDPRIKLFWTGPAVCSPSITPEDARKWAAWTKRKPFVWDNYPVNDMYPWRPLLSPVKARSADLAPEVSGFMSNPMKQWHASTIPLRTLADYLNRPATYDPAKSMSKAIAEYPVADRLAVKRLVDLYGSSFWGEPGFPPKPTAANRQSAESELKRYKDVKKALSSRPSLRNLWLDVQPTLDEDIRMLERKAVDRRVSSPLRVLGDDFEGGAGSVFGYSKFGKAVNYVYAASTGRNKMSAVFYLKQIAPGGYGLRISAMNDDAAKLSRIVIRLGSTEVYSGPPPFTSSGFSEHVFDVSSSAVKLGANTLVIENADADGTLGMPPWFMVAEAELTPAVGTK